MTGHRVNHYFATCARGLEPVLARELAGLDAEAVKPGRGGVGFRGGPALLYRANLHLRSAVRVLRPIFEGDVFSPDDLYDAVRCVEWDEYLDPGRTLAVDCNVRDSAITHSQYAARRVKDAVCDQFMDRVGRRPSVNVETPAVGINLHVHANRAVLSLDSSWQSLHKRGYRPVQTRAPLNEALAAGLLLHMGYDGSEPLADPLCGSGTFPIEGAWVAMNRPPGLTRPWFGFFGWPDFDPGLWSAVRDDARRRMRPAPPFAVVGSDERADAVEFAVGNAKAAGVGHATRFVRWDVRDTRAPDGPPGLVVCNPPYGERLGEEAEWAGLYRAIGEAVAHNWPGWRLAVFTSADRLAQEIRLKKRRVTAFFNGSLKCRLWEFEPG